ncbi:MAG: histidinol-phosphate transaminase [Imperialibacter sp.]|uniref:pyridoxal phosphate-dependent aminotransferase n=1 Tax=Imperialibacter sp. TaxID=2038411 RepID=UPI0032EC9669
MKTSLTRRQALKAGTLAASAAFINIPSLFAKSPSYNAEFISMTDEERAFYYFQGQEGVKARLFANENPFGPSEKAMQAIRDSLKDSYMYPFDERAELQRKIAAYEGVSEDHILLGAGSTQLLMAAGAAFGMKGGEIVISHPTFDSLPKYAEGVGGKLVKVDVDSGLKQQLGKMADAVNAKTSLVYAVNPMNPTGTQVSGQEMRDFCNSFSSKAPVFVDEAYIDYHPEGLKASTISCVQQGKNVIVCKTFSKVHGFAGLRVGYCVAKPDLLSKMKPFSTGGFDLSRPAVLAATASVDDKAFLSMSVQQTEESKQLLYKGLKAVGASVIPSFTNFAMFPIDMNGSTFLSRMKEKGVLVRSWNFKNQDWCRVSIGRKDEMEAFNKALAQVV